MVIPNLIRFLLTESTQIQDNVAMLVGNVVFTRLNFIGQKVLCFGKALSKSSKIRHLSVNNSARCICPACEISDRAFLSYSANKAAAVISR